VSEINWTLWLIAAAMGVMVGFIILAIGMWMDKRAENKRLGDELCATQAEMEGDDRG
jgi:uncharacterized membrane-anchored protein YhcB (DUF1043 family)